MDFDPQMSITMGTAICIYFLFRRISFTLFLLEPLQKLAYPIPPPQISIEETCVDFEGHHSNIKVPPPLLKCQVCLHSKL